MRKTVAEWGDHIVGWRKIEVCGFYVEEFLNAVKNENIEIWELRKKDQCSISFKIHSFSEEKLFEVAESKRSLREMEVTVCESGGLIEDILRYKLRSGLFVGFIFAVVLFFVMTSFIWKIEITGLNSIPEEKLLEALAENGIAIGALTTGHDFQKIKYDIIHDFKNIAYITVNMKGCKAEVEVDESVIPPEIDETFPCNIVAKNDGQILLIEAYKGIPQVKKYEAVRKGQLLVGGIYNSNVIGYRLVHSEAKIMARMRQTYTEFCPFVSSQIEETGKTDVFYELKIFGLNIDLSFFKKNNYGKYESISEETELRIGEDLVLPISLVKTVVYEQNEKPVVHDEDSATAYIESVLNEKMRIALHGIEVESIEKRFSVDENGVYGVYDLTVIDDICEVREIEVEIKE